MDQSTILLTITMFFLLAINSSDLLSQSTDPFVPTDLVYRINWKQRNLDLGC